VILNGVHDEAIARANLRRGTSLAAVAILSMIMLALAAGVGPTLAEDTWAALILFAPVMGVILGGLVVRTPTTPSSALLSNQGWGSVWHWFVAPYRVPLVTPIAFAAVSTSGPACRCCGVRPGVSAGSCSKTVPHSAGISRSRGWSSAVWSDGLASAWWSCLSRRQSKFHADGGQIARRLCDFSHSQRPCWGSG
jgi:hypothetical protein